MFMTNSSSSIMFGDYIGISIPFVPNFTKLKSSIVSILCLFYLSYQMNSNKNDININYRLNQEWHVILFNKCKVSIYYGGRSMNVLIVYVCVFLYIILYLSKR